MKFSTQKKQDAIKPVSRSNSMDQSLRSSLWNVLQIHLFKDQQTSPTDQLMHRIKTEFLVYPADVLVKNGNTDQDRFSGWFKAWFQDAEANKVFDLIEFIISFMDNQEGSSPDNFINDNNSVLEEEGATYRIVNRKVVRAIAGTDLKAIEQAVRCTAEQDTVKKHFSKALELLAERKCPDYRQAVLEAIAAVDWMMARYPYNRVNGDAELPTNANPNHFVSIRYALEGGLVVSFEKARYWLVACAVSVNYLKTIGE